MTFYNHDELTNEEYHTLPQVSGSTLSAIYNDCPAAWRYAERVETKALSEGTAAHAILLEPELFRKTYVRAPDIADYKEALVTTKDLQAHIKKLGIKGASAKTKSELISIVLSDENPPLVWDVFVKKFEDTHSGKELLAPDVYDRLHLMRQTIFNDPVYLEALTGADVEMSYVDQDADVKARWDIVTKDGEIWDYKTTTSANPEEFGKHAHNYGYWLKMAFQHDVYILAHGEPPRRVVLLAQSKKSPYIPQAYEMTGEQLEVGREQYQVALDQYKRAKELDVWPAYGGGVQELPTPEWLIKKYGMDK